MSSRDHDRRHRDELGPRSRETSDRRQHHERPRTTEHRRDRRSSHDLRDQHSRHTRRFTEEARQPPAAQTSNKEQPTVDAEAHPSDAHPAELQQPPAVGAAVAQAMPSAGSIQRQHGYLADSLRDNKQREADAGGYVSNRDRQQSYRQHPYHRTRHDDHGYRGPSDHRHGGRRGQEWPARGRGGGGFGGGFGGGGKWKHDMFEELANETKASEASNLVQAPAAATSEIDAAQQPAAPSQTS